MIFFLKHYILLHIFWWNLSCSRIFFLLKEISISYAMHMEYFYLFQNNLLWNTFWVEHKICSSFTSKSKFSNLIRENPNYIGHPTIETWKNLAVGVISKVDLCILNKIKIVISFKKSKLIHFESEKYETSIILKKCNLFIIVLFESQLFKKNKHNYKQLNIMKIKKLDLNN